MPARTDEFDLGRLHLQSGEGRRLDLEVDVDAFLFGGERYAVAPHPLAVVLDVSKMTGGGHSLRLRMTATLDGPCMRCLGPASPAVDVDAREVDQPGGGDELDSPYVDDEKFGQALKAFVVAGNGGKLLESEVKKYVKENLAGYKVPKSVEFLDELPRNATGKVLKRELAGDGDE